jgi:hypothetical protein
LLSWEIFLAEPGMGGIQDTAGTMVPTVDRGPGTSMLQAKSSS